MARCLRSQAIVIGVTSFLCLLTYCEADDKGADVMQRVLDAITELGEKMEDLESTLARTRKELLSKLDVTKNEFEAKIEPACDRVRRDVETRLDRLESAFEKTGLSKDYKESTGSKSTSMEVENDLDVVERRILDAFNSTCGGLTSEWMSSFGDVTSSLDRTSSDLETEKDTLSAVVNKMSSIESMVNATYTALIEHGKNWTDVHSERSRCQEGWMLFDDSCYFFSFTEGNWSAGRQECLGMDSDYVKVTSTKEWNFIASHITSNSWVGLTDQDEEGTFKWISDGTVESAKDESWWHQKQPDDHLGNEDCIHYWFFWEKNLWNDADCSQNMRYICEMRPSDHAA